MSIRSSFTGAEMLQAIKEMDLISRDVPIATTLRELQLVVERLTFSRLHERDPQNDDATLAQVDLYFRDEVSAGMADFVHRLAEQELLAAIAGEQGRIFLDRCMTAYRRVSEVKVVTALALEERYRLELTERLRAVHPEPTRILFSVSPSVIAGFVITQGQKVVDRSLRTHVTSSISKASVLQGLASDGGASRG